MDLNFPLRFVGLAIIFGRGDDKDRDDSDDDRHHLPRVNGQVVHCAGNPRASGASVPFVNTLVLLLLFPFQ